LRRKGETVQGRGGRGVVIGGGEGCGCGCRCGGGGDVAAVLRPDGGRSSSGHGAPGELGLVQGREAKHGVLEVEAVCLLVGRWREGRK
jgi:hypothetical protein